MYLIWSGGCDSTLMLDWLSEYASSKQPLRVVTIKSDAIDTDQQKLEARAREKIKERYKDKAIVYAEIETEIKAPDGEFLHKTESRSYGLAQVTFWLGSVMPFMSNHCDIYFGYVKEDCFWHYRSHVDSIIKSMAMINGMDDVVLKYPYEWETKENIIRRLKEKKLLDLVWYCEAPKDGKPCGRCGSCETHDRALYFIKEAEKSERLEKIRQSKKRVGGKKIIKPKKKSSK